MLAGFRGLDPYTSASGGFSKRKQTALIFMKSGQLPQFNDQVHRQFVVLEVAFLRDADGSTGWCRRLRRYALANHIRVTESFCISIAGWRFAKSKRNVLVSVAKGNRL